MQIELLGCTGVGKSTLADRMREANVGRGLRVVLGDELVLRRHRLNWVKPYLARTLLIDVLAAGACLATWRGHREFHHFATRVIFGLPTGWYEKLNLARNVLKKIGIYEIVKRYDAERQIVLVDEGTLHAAHNLFVHLRVEPDPADFETFLRLVPMPDVALLVVESESVVIERTLRRGHPRIPSGSRPDVERFVRLALELFERLAAHASVRERTLLLDRRHGGEIRPARGGAAPLEAARDLVHAALDPGDHPARPARP